MNENFLFIMSILLLLCIILLAKAIIKATRAYIYGRQGGYHAVYRHQYTYWAWKLGRKAYKKKWARKVK